jgi:hypothetical protein
MVTNEQLAEALVRVDPSTRSWVYNKYCGYCGRFAYQDDIAAGTCKKCNTSLDRAILRPLPFLTSATAIEKLAEWAIRYDKEAADLIKQVITGWLSGDFNCVVGGIVNYKEIVVTLVSTHLSKPRS